MEAMELLKTRRSIRKFRPEPVSRETLEQIVDGAAYAPSWKNTQIARYYVVEDPEKRAYLAEACTMGFAHNRGILEQTPQIVVLAAKKGRSGVERDGSFSTSKGSGWLMFDAGVAAQTFCLAAHACGVGTVIMGVFDAEKTAEALAVPADQEVVALIAMGYPDETPNPPKRKETAELLTLL